MPTLTPEQALRLGISPPCRTMTPVAGVLIDHAQAGAMMSSYPSGAFVGAHVLVRRGLSHEVLLMMTPDDADRMADELKIAATLARNTTVPAPAERRAFSVSIYARRGDKLLVIHHRRLDLWLPVGGEIEAGETPGEAAARELREETELIGYFGPVAGAFGGSPKGYLGYEEHDAGSKGLHMNFVFIALIADDREVVLNGEATAYRWVDRVEFEALTVPPNVREFGRRAFDARIKKVC